MKLSQILKRELERGITVMFIPHNSVRPLKLSISLSFLLFLLAFWTGITITAGYLYSRHIDYVVAKADNRMMKLKVSFFAKEVKKSRELLEQVKENDQQVRTLLEMKSKKDIVETEGKGGPSKDDVKDLSRLLEGKIYEMNQQDIRRQTLALEQESKKRLESYNEITKYVYNLRALFRATPASWPCKGHVTSAFGLRIHPIFSDEEFHAGLDIANEKNTPVYSTADGIIKFSDWQSGYGRLIIVDNGYGYSTYYGHLAKILVNQGDKIRRGQMIGLMGCSGTSTGNHLHYEIQSNGKPVDPTKFLKTLSPSGYLAKS
jgi:murein DD-endopeptidase MepM/ murein hydrolase activator NlpD